MLWVNYMYISNFQSCALELLFPDLLGSELKFILHYYPQLMILCIGVGNLIHHLCPSSVYTDSSILSNKRWLSHCILQINLQNTVQKKRKKDRFGNP